MRHAVLDGDAIVQDAKGVANYHSLRRELARKRSGKLNYYAFDLLYLDGKDLRQETLLTRKQMLTRRSSSLPITSEAQPDDIYVHACRMGLEGIVSKRRDAPYRSGGQEAWIKANAPEETAFLITFVEKLGAKPRRMASFYIGRWEERRLLYAGKVQSGFTHEEARAVCERLDALITSKSPLDEPIKKAKATWVTAGPRRGASTAQKKTLKRRRCAAMGRGLSGGHLGDNPSPWGLCTS